MLYFSTLVFDEIIVGTGTTWYTSAEFNAQLGSADMLALCAWVSYVSGNVPTLTCQAEHSPDGEHWAPEAATPAINAGIAGPDQVITASPHHQHLALVRYAVTLNGMSPKCRLKLYVSGRTR